MTRPSARAPAGRRWLAFGLRLGLSAGMVAALLSLIDVRRVGLLLSQGDATLIATAALAFLCGQILAATRWRLVLSTHVAKPPSVRYLTGLFLVGMFFNFFLPSTVGGDLVRAEIATPSIGSRMIAYTSVLFDRLIAFTAVVAIGLGGLLLLPWGTASLDPHVSGAALALLLFALLAFAVLSTRLALRLMGRPWPGPLAGICTSLQRIHAALRAYLSHPRVLGLAFLLSVLIHLVGVVLTVYLLAASLYLDVPLSLHLVAVPLITLVSLVPVSINGIGVREAAYVFLYGKFGVPPDAALALAFAWLIILMVFSLVGGLLLVLSPHRPRPSSPPR